jgi:hypothetical protein
LCNIFHLELHFIFILTMVAFNARTTIGGFMPSETAAASILSLIDLRDLPVILSAMAAIGTASFGLMDSTKAINGGISNWGFGFIREALRPMEPTIGNLGNDPYELAKANWINGVAKDNQKMVIRNMIRLGLTEESARRLDANVIGVEPAELAEAARRARNGEKLDEQDLAVLARFDAVIDLRRDTAFERADQRFRNASRLGAALVAIFLSQAGAFTVFAGGTTLQKVALGLVVGLVAVPLAPVAKDLSSAVTTAVAAFKSVRK